MYIVIYELSSPDVINKEITSYFCINKPNYIYPISKVHSISICHLKGKCNYNKFKIDVEYSYLIVYVIVFLHILNLKKKILMICLKFT